MLENNGLAINRLNALGAALNLSFVGGEELNSRITFTRASGATRFKSNGLMEVVGNDVARFDYDPAVITGYSLGAELINLASAVGGLGGILSIAGNSITITQGIAASFGQAIVPYSGTIGKKYRFSFDVYSPDGLAAAITQFNAVTQSTVMGDGQSVTNIVTAGPNQLVLAHNNSDTIGTRLVYSNVSVKEATPVCAPRGLLIEESRTNLLTYSEDQTNAIWVKTDVTINKNQIGLTGSANSACLITEGVAGTATTIQTSGTVASSSTHTYTVLVKRGSATWIRLAAASPAGNGWQGWFNLATGVVGTSSALGTGTGSISLTNLGGGFYACKIVSTISAVDVMYNCSMHSASADNSIVRVNNATYIVSGAQLELGSFATSYIPTTSAAVTRTTDNAIIDGTNFSSWWNPVEGTIVMSAEYASASPTPVTYSVNNAGSSFMLIYNGRFAAANVVGVAQGDFAAGIIPTPGIVHKSSLGYKAADCALAINGGALGTSGVWAIPTVTRMILGGPATSTAQKLNGHVQSFAYYNTRKTNAELQTLSL